VKVDKADLQNALQAKYSEGPRKCLLCGGQMVWDLTIFELREYNKGSLVIGGKDNTIVPLIIAICQNCGHVEFFNAIKLGLIDPRTADLVKSE
jgi:predicted nucleic-acid-binding Zn-ribbon protein